MRHENSMRIDQVHLDDDEFHRFRDLIVKRSGIHFDQSKKETLKISLLSRITARGLQSFAHYFQLLCSRGGAEEFDQLLNLITIPETFFFRDQAQLMALKRYVIPDILAKRSGEDSTLRIWSAGCSTGEEPYTIAMIVAEGMPGVVLPRTRILATDISRNALAAAREGLYRSRSLQSTEDDYRERYFSRRGNMYALNEAIKQMVEFRYFNLMREPYPLLDLTGWDIIFCRNVTIYFQPEVTKRVVHNFYESLREGGYLFTGFSESLRYVSDEFTAVQLGGIFLYQKKAVDRDIKKREKSRPIAPQSRRLQAPVGKRRRQVKAAPSQKTAASQQTLYRAKELLEDGKPEQAHLLLAPILEQRRPPIEALLLQAEIALNQGDMADAAKVCQKVIGVEPLSVAGHYLLGIIYRILEKEEKAIEMFKKVVYLKPDQALAHFYLGELHALGGDLDTAGRYYANAVRLLQESPESFDNRFAGGFSLGLLVDTCRSRLESLSSRRRLDSPQAESPAP
jgi:chemotaxis protein methyltransferase CheR